MDRPKAYIDDIAVKPVGNVMSITDPIKFIYKIFYHENNNAFDKIPDIKADGIKDKSMTDRSIIGVCMNQLRGSSGEIFKYLVTDDQKMMQFVVFMRSDKADFLKDFNNRFYSYAKKLFPANDPYVEKIVISGMPAINMTMNQELYDHHIQSICLTVFVVFLCCLWIFRSFTGAVFSVIPLSITVIINMGIMGYFDFPINYATVMIASIAIGAGIDFTIHFLERFKYEHLIMGNDFRTSYFNTLETKGEAIIISAFAIAGGFGVLMLSTFKMLSMSGLMVALAMLLSGAASIIVLPALLNWIRPDYIERKEKFLYVKPLILEYLEKRNADAEKESKVAGGRREKTGKAEKSKKKAKGPTRKPL
jgi:predicted RND superfamily exporter protein